MPGEAIMNNEDAVRNEWGQICSQLRTEVGEKAFDSWLKPLSVGSFANGIMNICVPTRFMRNWVITNYSDRIHKIWEKKKSGYQKHQLRRSGNRRSGRRHAQFFLPFAAEKNCHQSGAADRLPAGNRTGRRRVGRIRLFRRIRTIFVGAAQPAIHL